MHWLLFQTSLTSLCGSLQFVISQPQYRKTPNHRRENDPPVILPGGYIADTEEVAAAKDAHFSAFARAASLVNSGYSSPGNQGIQIAYHRQAAASRQKSPTYSHEQSAPQTHQVQSNVEHQEPIYDYQEKTRNTYHGPPVIPVILPNGYIADTHDVSAAKEEHFAAFEKAQAAVARAQARSAKEKYAGRYIGGAQDKHGHYSPDDISSEYNIVYEEPEEVPVRQQAQMQFNHNNDYPTRFPHNGPVVLPVVYASGHIADTQEVAAAKIAHLKLLIQASQGDLSQNRRGGKPKTYLTSRITVAHTPSSSTFRTAEIILMLVIFFMISWTPYAIITFIGQFGNPHWLSPWITAMPAIFAKGSVVYNPIIYGLSHPHFRSSVRQYISACTTGANSTTTMAGSQKERPNRKSDIPVRAVASSPATTTPVHHVMQFRCSPRQIPGMELNYHSEPDPRGMSILLEQPRSATLKLQWEESRGGYPRVMTTVMTPPTNRVNPSHAITSEAMMTAGSQSQHSTRTQACFHDTNNLPATRRWLRVSKR